MTDLYWILLIDGYIPLLVICFDKSKKVKKKLEIAQFGGIMLTGVGN